tara:strand:+ start:61701 stop:61853 length:153 start_codon:yes stop_codon:yes gene_type:complete
MSNDLILCLLYSKLAGGLFHEDQGNFYGLLAQAIFLPILKKSKKPLANFL